MTNHSKLLIDDRPIMVLPRLAAQIGLNAAIVIQQIHYWLITYQNAGKLDHYRDGQWWVYNTKAEWTENFPWWSESTVWRALTELRNLGLVKTAKYNRRGYDRTLWYSIDYEALQKLELCDDDDHVKMTKSILSKWQNGSCQNDKMDHVKMTSPIPETTIEQPENNTENTGASAPISSPPSKPTPLSELQRKFGSDPLSGLVSAHKRQAKSNGLPAGWGRASPDVWAVCELVARQFPCRLPVVKESHNANTAEMARQQIDKWRAGAALLLDNFDGDKERTLGAIRAFRRNFDGGFTVAGPQSLVNSVLPGGNGRNGQGAPYESQWTKAELEEARRQSLAETPLDPATFFDEE
ncbi:MAG: hypothetical protein DRJ03_13155 [Chloroflexi bacterium]|nr:MAG: hypothetical protein DRJ03_13155 [Chloroflexota bacterium]